jgi:tRNA1(Val) A37 N6-methylase TrmN6
MADAGLTRDAFLGGRVLAWQPAKGYRAGADAVLLASAVRASSGETVLELGCGVGVASLCLAARVPDVTITGIEADPATADIASRNVAAAEAPISIHRGDLQNLRTIVDATHFDHVMMNPPYFRAGSTAPDRGRAAARHEDAPLSAWLEHGIRRLCPKGQITIIQKVDRLLEVVDGVAKSCGDIEVTPVAGRAGKAPSRVIVRARKGSKGPFSLTFPLIMHDGMSHLADGDDHSASASAILRHGTSLDAATKC